MPACYWPGRLVGEAQNLRVAPRTAINDSSFQLLRNGTTVNLSQASGPDGDALIGLSIVDQQVTTTTTESTQIGTQQVQIGSTWKTYDINLTQSGFYNPDSQAIREFFIPSVDFQIKKITWGSTPTPAADLAWNQYSTEQRNAVLNAIGFLPLHALTVSNIVQHETRNGVLTSTPIANPWANDDNAIAIPDSGQLSGLAIAGTKGALDNVLSLTSAPPQHPGTPA